MMFYPDINTEKLGDSVSAPSSAINNSVFTFPPTPSTELQQDAHIDAVVQEKVALAMKEISEKYDFVLNKLVGAVDAEFTLLNNRIKALEAQLAEKNNSSS